MTRRRLTLLALLAVGLAAIAGTLAGRWHSRGPSGVPPPRLVVADGQLDLGDRYECAACVHRFRVDNPTDLPVTVFEARSTCDCLAIRPGVPFVIPPGGSKEVEAVVSLKVQSACQRAMGLGEPSRIPIRVVYGESRQRREEVWELTALVRPVVRIAQPTVRFGLVSTRDRVRRDVVVEVADHVRRIESPDSPNWVLKGIGDTAGRAMTLTLEQRAPVRLGEVSETITLVPFDAAGDRLPESHLTVTAEFADDIIPVPREVRLGRRAVGDGVDEVVVFRSLSGVHLRSVEVRRAPAVIVVTPAPADAGQPALRFRVLVAEGGEGRAEVEVVVTDDEGQQTPVRVPVNWFGVGGG
jgi:hypothetical protein